MHTAALQQAVKGSSKANLKEAYFLEAYGQHFLTDTFSAGHLRAPRRILHSTSPLKHQPRDPDRLFALWPGDQCCRDQHDEDCANGLWVTNALGESWAVCGDKQILDGRSAKNLQYAIQASQRGVDEVWKTFETGVIPQPSEFSALEKAGARNPLLNNRI